MRSEFKTIKRFETKKIMLLIDKIQEKIIKDIHEELAKTKGKHLKFRRFQSLNEKTNGKNSRQRQKSISL
jgi:hypothetical protein